MAGGSDSAAREERRRNGDERTYESCVALRAVASTDGMTADWVHLPYDFLAAVSNDIINKVRGSIA